MSVSELIAAGLVILGGMAGIIKAMVLGRLDKIDRKLDKQADQLANHDGRIIRIEEWRANLTAGAPAGRRASDRCPAPDCPFEEAR